MNGLTPDHDENGKSPNRSTARNGQDQSIQNQDKQLRTRQKNKDENPQEFEEADSQDEQCDKLLIPKPNKTQK